VPAYRVWEILRKHGIQLQRRRGWCVSIDPEFAPKAAEIVALYLDQPENAVVLAVDEKPHSQTLERAQGYLRLPNGRALRGVSHEYKRHGTTTLFAALNVHSGAVHGKHAQRRRRREFLAFMNEVVADYPVQEIHVVLDNLNTHKPKHDRWLARHPNVHFHFTPTHASWLNQIETWFSILSRQALRGSSFRSPREVRDRIDAFIAAYNRNALPFRWRAAKVHPVDLKRSPTFVTEH
jgi:transposase